MITITVDQWPRLVDRLMVDYENSDFGWMPGDYYEFIKYFEKVHDVEILGSLNGNYQWSTDAIRFKSSEDATMFKLKFEV